MHLCDIPSERISEVEIPTGLPLIFDVNQKCLRLLDDGKYDADPSKALKRWNFGTATDLLFKPCDSNDPDAYCDVDQIPDPIIRLDQIPDFLDKPPERPEYSRPSSGNGPYDSADDLVLGALLGVDTTQEALN